MLALPSSALKPQKPSGKSALPFGTPKSGGWNWKWSATAFIGKTKTLRGRILSACLLPFLLSGCGGSTPSVDDPEDTFPPSLTRPCPRPVALPDAALNDQQVEVFWGRDRKALLDCGGRLEVLAGRSPGGR